MEYIHSKDIFLLIRDTLKLVDTQEMEHGSRVAYLLYKMLECRGGYEKFELADFVFLASLHDIGAYKTDKQKDIVYYDCKEPRPHATYGYLVFKYLSPLSELASVILYHHMDYVRLQEIDDEYRDIAAFLGFAEKVDIFSGALKDSFDIQMFKKQEGAAISPEALELYEQAVLRYDILKKIRSGEYKEELEAIIEYMIFTNEDKKKYLEMLMYCQGFGSEKTVVDTATCMSIAEMLGQTLMLSDVDREQLYYGALLHDIGMMLIPEEIINAPRKLTVEEYERIKTHVHLAERVLSNRMAKEVLDIVAAHHERCDGSGYPRGLRETQMNHNQEILQLADTVTALVSDRSYRKALGKEEIIPIIKAGASEGKYSKAISKAFLENYDEIMKKVKIRSDEIMGIYRKLNQQYDQVSGKL